MHTRLSDTEIVTRVLAHYKGTLDLDAAEAESLENEMWSRLKDRYKVSHNS